MPPDVSSPARLSEMATLVALGARHGVDPDGALDVLPLRALDVDQLAECRITRAREAAHRVEQPRIDPPILPYRRIDMGVDDAAEHNVGVAVGDDLGDLAFDMRLGFAHPVGPHLPRPHY